MLDTRTVLFCLQCASGFEKGLIYDTGFADVCTRALV